MYVTILSKLESEDRDGELKLYMAEIPEKEFKIALK